MSKSKKLHSFDELARLFGVEKSEESPLSKKDENDDFPPKEDCIELHFSKKGRAGKIVTILKGFEADEEQIKHLSKYLKMKLGVGGSVKDDEIIIQGNHRDKIAGILKELGYCVKRVGG